MLARHATLAHYEAAAGSDAADDLRLFSPPFVRDQDGHLEASAAFGRNSVHEIAGVGSVVSGIGSNTGCFSE